MRGGAILSLAIAAMLAGCKAAPAPDGRATAERPECAPVPAIALAGRVTDGAGIFSASDERRLDARLADYERRTRHQMVVLTTGLSGIPIETFATCTGNRWGIGRAKEDDGILILVAPSERQARIATGLGMEKILTDAKAAEVIQVMMPHFSEGDYAGGVDTAITAIAARTETGQ